MALINIGSTAGFNAVLSHSLTALMGTYVISIGCLALRRFRKEPLPPARWSLGEGVYSFFWSFWPNAYAMTAVNFSWTSMLFVGLMGLVGVLYVTHARHVYDGPVARVVSADAEVRDTANFPGQGL
ncbi:hypothetical protein LTR35_018002 [Friedmanniomyces endolithicus]|nr:hypothetical protein LTR35_018002 [Friedmanniomyces endolithicus]KAK0969853.1 hypothetical protein LTR54_018043 [Friedmanniomyces endolithicus]